MTTIKGVRCPCPGLVKEPYAAFAFDEDVYECMMCGHMIGEHDGTGSPCDAIIDEEDRDED